ncbi:hypothetical protein Y032_0025g1283 [Ancylostoma ceylanicum]|uniref:Uncharacterized protein n=1 Tax=Ancylostoma ceylanicum TaxID=53326 RepID=A0A016UWX3_9BILA|nr:hypothetical protein Y032_0025g1283 [Ancylostoma ceylanicum]
MATRAYQRWRDGTPLSRSTDVSTTVSLQVGGYLLCLTYCCDSPAASLTVSDSVQKWEFYANTLAGNAVDDIDHGHPSKLNFACSYHSLFIYQIFVHEWTDNRGQ